MGKGSPLFPKLSYPFHALRLPSGQPVHWPKSYSLLDLLTEAWVRDELDFHLDFCPFGLLGFFPSCLGFPLLQFKPTAIHLRLSTPSNTPTLPHPTDTNLPRSRLSELQETRSAQHPALDAFWGALRRQIADRTSQTDDGQRAACPSLDMVFVA